MLIPGIRKYLSKDNGKTPVDTFFHVEFNNVKRKEQNGVKWCYFRLEISDSV